MYLPLLGHFLSPQSPFVDGYTEVWGDGAAHLCSSQDRGGPMRRAAESQVVPKNIAACSSILQPPHIPLGCSLFPALRHSEAQQYRLQQEQNGIQVSPVQRETCVHLAYLLQLCSTNSLSPRAHTSSCRGSLGSCTHRISCAHCRGHTGL